MKKVESNQAENMHRNNQGNLEITGPKVASPGPQGRFKCLIFQFLPQYFTLLACHKGCVCELSRSDEKVIRLSEQETSHLYEKFILIFSGFFYHWLFG